MRWALALLLLAGCEALWGGFKAPHQDLAAAAEPDLTAAPGDLAGLDQGGPGDLGACSAAQCPGGCCQAGSCVAAPVFPLCGRIGNACVSCDTRSDRCDARGGCSCGGIAPPCQSGQRCVAGECKCDATSCPSGCCQGAGCVAAPAFPVCGGGGAACESCDDKKADRCVTGKCSCGGRGKPCMPTDTCSFGECI